MANKPAILIAAWVIYFLEIGTVKSFSVLLIHIARDIDTTPGRIGMYVGMYHAIPIMSAPFVVKLLKRHSPRLLCMLGGLIGSVGLMCCCTVMVDTYFAVCLIISGLGFSLCRLTPYVSIIYAFRDQYLLPISVGYMGAGVGMMTLPIFTQKLLEAYNWRGTFLILGALNLHVVVFGSCLEPTVLSYEPQDSTCESSETQETRETSRTQSLTTALVKQKTGLGDGNEPKTQPSLLLRCCCSALKPFQTFFQSAGFNVFKEYPTLLYILPAAYLHGLTSVSWTVFVISNAELKGFAEEIAVFVSLLGGIGNTIGRLMPGLFNFLRKDIFTSRTLFILFGIIGALPLCLNTITSHFPLLCVFAALNGFAIGGKTSVKGACVIDIVPRKWSTSVLAVSSFCTGIGEITGGWITGLIFDVTGSMDTAFLFLGCADIFGVVLLLLSLLHEKILHLNRQSSDRL